MMRLSLLTLFLSVLLAANGDFLIGPEELAGWVNVSNQVVANTISDYYATINEGHISANTLNLNGSLSAGTADLGDVWASNVTTADLATLNTTTPWLSTEELRVTGNSTFHSPVEIDDTLTVGGGSWLGNTDVSSLTSTGKTEVTGNVFAQKNVQITNSLTVMANARVFGDAIFNSSLVVGGNVTVNDQAQILRDLVIQNQLTTDDLTVTGIATLGSINVAGALNVTGYVRVYQDVNATNARFVGSLSAQNLTVAENWNGKSSLTSGATLSVARLTTLNGNFAVSGAETVAKSMSVDGTGSFSRGFNVLGNATVGANVTSGATFTAIDSMFDTLSVDAGTIQTLTSTFITSNNLVSTDATITNSFVSGRTTLNTLVVTKSTTLTTATATSIKGTTIDATNATFTDLDVSESGHFVNVQVKTSITAGTPSQDSFFGAFENTFTDQLEFVNLEGTRGNVSDIEGNTLSYQSQTGVNLMVNDVTSTSGEGVWWYLTNATINTIDSNDTEIDWIWAGRLGYEELDALNAWTDQTVADDTTSQWVNGTDASIEELTTTTTESTIFIGESGSVGQITANKGWIENLKSSDATITNLWSSTAQADFLHGDDITSASATVTRLSSVEGVTSTFDATDSITTKWLWSKQTNATTLETKSLRVTSGGWFENVLLDGDLWVGEDTTLQNGSLSGVTVLASLDVVSGADLLGGFSSTETSFFTDLSVKRVTITDSFQANSADLGSSTLATLSVSNSTKIDGFLNITKDILLGGNLVVTGTTQFQTGSFTRIGTAIITTTDMEAFNLNVAEGTFGDVTVGDFSANKGVVFERSISLAPLIGDGSGAEHSLFMQIAPTTFQGVVGNSTFDVNTLAYLHTGNASLDALVVTTASDPNVAAFRIKGDGSIDIMDGDILFNELNVQGGMVFENENNIAWSDEGVSTNVSLSQGGKSSWYRFSQLQDRDDGAPGAEYDPTRFHAPTQASDLITLSPGHYRVSGTVNFAPVGAVTTPLVAVVVASVSGWLGTQSNSSAAPTWTTSCVANFNLVVGSIWGGSCSFEDVVVVSAGQTLSLATSASWVFSSVASSQTLTITPQSSIQIAEYFERVSQGLSA